MHACRLAPTVLDVRLLPSPSSSPSPSFPSPSPSFPSPPPSSCVAVETPSGIFKKLQCGGIGVGRLTHPCTHTPACLVLTRTQVQLYHSHPTFPHQIDADTYWNDVTSQAAKMVSDRHFFSKILYFLYSFTVNSIPLLLSHQITLSTCTLLPSTKGRRVCHSVG